MVEWKEVQGVMGSVVLELNYIGAATCFHGHRERRQLPCPSLSTRELNRAAILGQAHSPRISLGKALSIDSRAEPRSDSGPGPFSKNFAGQGPLYRLAS